jgi:hypothetical protein
MLTAWVLFPLALLALCAGLGLLVDELGGRRLPGALIPPVGMAAIVVVGQVTTLLDATAEATGPLLVVLALLGAGLALREWRFDRVDPLPAIAALGVFAAFGAPVLLSGEPTFLGYVMLDDTATWLALTDHVMVHGHDLGHLQPSSYEATLNFYSGGYPVGTFLPLGAAARLGGGEVACLGQPYTAFLAAMLALALWELAGGLLRPTPARALVAFLAAQPALLYAYSLWGGVKEVGAAALVALVAALAPPLLRQGARPREALPLALACGALAAELSIGGLAWVAPALLALAALALLRLGRGAALRLAIAFAALLVVLAIPVVANGFSPPVAEPLTSNALGNLIEPLEKLQLIGIWPAGDFRLPPDATLLTSLLIATAIVAAAIGAGLAWRRGATGLLIYAAALVACFAIVAVGSPWNGAKALATASPIVLLLALAGSVAAAARERLALVMLAAVGAGVLWSNVLAYHDVSLAPYGQLSELEAIAGEIDGEGPTLMTEYQPYGVRHFLRDAEAEAVSELRARPILRLDGTEVEKGRWEDTDGLMLDELLEYRTIVLRHSPAQSRPPSIYELVRRGDYYDVWQRPPGPPGRILAHLGLGDFADPAAVPRCADVLDLAGRAGPRGALATVERPAPVVAQVPVEGPLHFAVPLDAEYAVYLLGCASDRIEVSVDGEPVGSVADQRNPDAQFLDFGDVSLTAGPHRAELSFAGPSAAPGSGASFGPVGPLVLDPSDPRLPVLEVPASRARELCGRHLDWVEALPAGVN